MDALIAAGTLTSLGLAAWHHVGFPLALKTAARHRKSPVRPAAGPLPRITLIMPAYQEAAYVAAKIRNLAALDYPSDRLKVVLGCDGCTDATANLARAAHAEPECRHLDLEIVEFSRNRGKVAVVNDLVEAADGDIVAMSDISALVSMDALRLAADWFADPDVGVVCATYRLLQPGSPGEAVYWRYQTAIKLAESRVGSTMGAHGALYLFRRALFTPLEADTINDDFILPMRIVAQGFRAVYDPDLVALELERADPALDARRRRRIATGNVQQAVRLLDLLAPRHGWTAILFGSGKVLRVAMPVLLVLAVAGTAWLAPSSLFFRGLLALELLGLAAAALRALTPRSRLTAPLAPLHYLTVGHLASVVGLIRYLRGHDGRWQRATIALETVA